MWVFILSELYEIVMYVHSVEIVDYLIHFTLEQM
jgi:hypothetical protein